jgi:hypothetical protein
VVAALSRDAAGLQVRDAADPAALCPAGASSVGRAGEAALCAREGAGTAIAIAWDEAQTPALGAPPCPEGWTAWGGLDAATVCWHPASLPVARLARGPDGAGWPALLDEQAPCPAGYAPAGGAGQALVCVGLGDGG